MSSTSKLLKSTLFAIALLPLVLATKSAYALAVNGKEVTMHIGRIIAHNDRTGEIVIKTSNTTGRWHLNPSVAVFDEKHQNAKLYLDRIWGNAKRVKVWVAKDGEVEVLSVIEWQ